MGGVKIEAPRGWVWGGGVPLPTEGGVWEGAVLPPQKNFAFLASKSHVCDAL